eukprot:1013266-Rhodomonas_salina.2
MLKLKKSFPFIGSKKPKKSEGWESTIGGLAQADPGRVQRVLHPDAHQPDGHVQDMMLSRFSSGSSSSLSQASTCNIDSFNNAENTGRLKRASKPSGTPSEKASILKSLGKTGSLNRISWKRDSIMADVLEFQKPETSKEYRTFRPRRRYSYSSEEEYSDEEDYCEDLYTEDGWLWLGRETEVTAVGLPFRRSSSAAF